MTVGSAFLHSAVDLDVTPNPRGRSDIENITTPAFAGVFSVILARPDFRIWLPYRNDISEDDLTQTCSTSTVTLNTNHFITRWRAVHGTRCRKPG